MNRIDEKFKHLKNENRKAIIAYLTVGDPNLQATEMLALTAEKNGCDILKLGVAFSDPSAEAESIGKASSRALENGINIFKAFDFAKDLSAKVSMPIIISVYFNVVLKYGMDDFFAECHNSGIDAVSIPDLPFEECGEITEYTKKYNVHFICPISVTSDKRISEICKGSCGFLQFNAPCGDFADKYSDTIAKIRANTSLPIIADTPFDEQNVLSEIGSLCDGICLSSSIAHALESGNTTDEKCVVLANKLSNLASMM